MSSPSLTTDAVLRDGVPSSSTSRERLVFWGLCALLWAFFCFICSYSSTLLDDWYQVIYWQRHPFTLGSIWHNAAYNYLHYNPRLGENFLLLVNGPRWIYLALTPTVEMILLFTMFAIAFARWPRATLRDAQRIFVILVVLWMVAPVPGIMWFYRPFNTNYVYGFLLTLLVFVPYVFELARPNPSPPRWLAPLLFLCALAAGLSNEHTGPTAILALAILVYILWRRGERRLRAWMIAGLAGFVVGYPLLYFAPGQSERYSGIANRMGPLDFLFARGVSGTLEVIRSFIWEDQLAIYIVAGALLLARKQRPDSEPPPPPSTPQLVTIAFLLAAAFLIVITLFVSPTWGERLFFASAALFAIALVILLDGLMELRAVRRFVLSMCAVVWTYHSIRVLMIYPKEYAENQERIAAMAAAPPGGTAYIKPYTYGRTPWMNADDFAYASLREEVAHEAFGLDAVEYDRVARTEPSVPYHIALEYVFDPPVPADVVQKTVEFPLSFVPSYVDRDIQLIRRVLPQLKTKFPGHTLKKIVGHVVGYDLPELKGRPLIALVYDAVENKFSMVDVRRYADVRRFVDDQGMNYWLIWGESLPAGTNDAMLVSCGKLAHVPLTPDPDGLGWHMRITYDCRGLYVQLLCTPTECWLGGTGFR